MKAGRTDLVMEAAEGLAPEEREGLNERVRQVRGIEIREFEIQSDAAARRLGREKGRYVSLSAAGRPARPTEGENGPQEGENGRTEGRNGAESGPEKGESGANAGEKEAGNGPQEGGWRAMAEVLAEEVRRMVGAGREPVLVAALGNRLVTPDALGPLAAERLLVTRHLTAAMPELFGGFRPVSAVATGVLAATGVESGELIAGAVERVKPKCVIAIDALAARSAARLCATVQLCDSGIAPGSGVGNCRKALTRESLGVKVIAIGVPTVVDAATLGQDLLGRDEAEAEALAVAREMFVTPRDIDEKVALWAKIVGYGVNLGLQEGLSMEEMEELVE